MHERIDGQAVETGVERAFRLPPVPTRPDHPMSDAPAMGCYSMTVAN